MASTITVNDPDETYRVRSTLEQADAAFQSRDDDLHDFLTASFATRSSVYSLESLRSPDCNTVSFAADGVPRFLNVYVMWHPSDVQVLTPLVRTEPSVDAMQTLSRWSSSVRPRVPFEPK